VFYYYHSEVTVRTADKLFSDERSMQCVVAVVDSFLIIAEIL
jgi:hypothetical protein